MTEKWRGLVSTVLKFKDSIKEEFDKENEEFHSTINGKDPLRLMGFSSTEEEKNVYYVDPSDILFWHDPTAYVDELERWKDYKALSLHAEAKSYLYQTDQINVFNRLVESIKKKRLSPFVGAGLSASCGFPLWGEALSRLVKKLEGVSASDQRSLLPALVYLDEVKNLIESNKYLDATQLLYENHKTYLERFIHDTFDGANTLKIDGAIRLLPRISDGCIITTNFDGLIEEVYRTSGNVIEGYMHGIQSQNQFASKLVQGERCILKLHGNFNSPETYIFSKSQYDEAYGLDKLDYTKPLAKVLRQVFISHSLLFLGCSLEIDRTLNLFVDVASSNEFDIPQHFSFLPDTLEHSAKLEKEGLLMEAKIQPIWYTVKTDNNRQCHSQLSELMSFAIDCASGKTSV